MAEPALKKKLEEENRALEHELTTSCPRKFGSLSPTVT